MVRLMLAGLVTLFAAAPLKAQPCLGPGDVNGDGLVNVLDLDALGACLTGPGGMVGLDCRSADLDADGDADLADAARLALHAGRSYFVYGPHRPDAEAEQLAMQVSGALRAPDREYGRIRGDLLQIRAQYPTLQTVIDDPDYVPNQLIVQLVAGQPQTGYHELNEYYLLTLEEHLFGDWWVLTFCDNLNAVVLAGLYAPLPEVQVAEPNGLIGTDDQITIQVLGTTYRYRIDDGFMDCFDGCDCHRVWTIDVSPAGAVTLVSYEQYGMPWCQF